MTVLTNIILLITWSCLSVTQASSSFKLYDTRTLMYAIPTFITETLSLVTQVSLLLMTYSVSGLVSTTLTNAKGTPTNDNDYSRHITAVELVYPIIWGLYHAIS